MLDQAINEESFTPVSAGKCSIVSIGRNDSLASSRMIYPSALFEYPCGGRWITSLALFQVINRWARGARLYGTRRWNAAPSVSGIALVAVIYIASAVPSHAAEREVSFKTDDGLTIYGMYGAPEGGKGKVPAVIFLHSFEHDRNTYGQYLYPGLAQI